MYKNMKLFVCFLISLSTLMLSSAFAKQVTINTQVLNIRQDQSTSSAIIGKVNKNEKYEILEESDKWVKINKDNKQGWISKDYVIIEEDATTNQVTNVAQNKKVVTASKLNVRNNIGTNSPIVSSLSKDTVVTVLETKDGWDKISINNITGWVSNSYLTNYTQTNTNTNNNTATEQVAQTNNQKTLVITASVLNVRNSASSSGAILGKLTYNTNVIAVGIENGWYKIKYNNNYAYISAEYAKEQDVLSSRGDYVRDDSNIAAMLADKACTYLGHKYVYGGASPSGFDCSGLVYYVYKNYVTGLPRGATSQSKLGQYVEKENLQKGDLIYFTENQGTNITHVGIYLEDGYFVHAANPKRGVVKDTINSGYYYKNYLFAKRVI